MVVANEAIAKKLVQVQKESDKVSLSHGQLKFHEQY